LHNYRPNLVTRLPGQPESGCEDRIPLDIYNLILWLGKLYCPLQNKRTFHEQELIDSSVTYIVIVEHRNMRAMDKMRNFVMRNGNVKC